jgi:hypothetical protein
VVWVITHAFAAAFPFVASGYLQDTLSGYDWEQKLDPPMFREGVYVAAGVAVCSLLAALTSLLWARRLRAAAREGPLNGAGVASASISPEYVDLDLGGGAVVGAASSYDTGSRPLLGSIDSRGRSFVG